MKTRALRAPVHAWIRLASWPMRATLRFGRIFLLALAAAFGGPPPKLLPHHDDVVQVGDEREEE